MKRVVSVSLIVFMCTGLLPAAAQASPGTNYTLTGNQLEDMVAVANAQEGKYASDFGFNSEWCAYFVA